MTIRGIIYVEVNIGTKKRSMNLKIVEELKFEIILETNAIYGWGMILDFNMDRIQFKDTDASINMVSETIMKNNLRKSRRCGCKKRK
jgi:hypothetical protein